jgi:hypothetical protein
MESIVDGRLSFGFLVPVINALNERLAFVLDRKVDDACRASVGCGQCPGAEVV